LSFEVFESIFPVKAFSPRVPFFRSSVLECFTGCPPPGYANSLFPSLDLREVIFSQRTQPASSFPPFRILAHRSVRCLLFPPEIPNPTAPTRGSLSSSQNDWVTFLVCSPWDCLPFLGRAMPFASTNWCPPCCPLSLRFLRKLRLQSPRLFIFFPFFSFTAPPSPPSLSSFKNKAGLLPMS